MGNNDWLRLHFIEYVYGIDSIKALLEEGRFIVVQYSNLDDEYPNEYDNPIVKQIMEME